MMYNRMYQHDDETETNLLENLEALCHGSPVFTVDAEAFLFDEDDQWMLLEMHQRINIEVECWGRRLA